MIPNELHEKWKNVSSGPGVYLMKDIDGKIIYIGKALDLKKRLASYFSKNSQPDIKTSIMVGKIAQFETIITGTEKEALILESNLIKKHRPRYNVILKDDKRYPSLRLNIKTQYPFLSIVRKTEKDGSLYFGPFSSSSAVGQTIKIINKTFKLRKCKTQEPKKRSRPCLNYQMGICLAPCCHNVPQDIYNKMVHEVTLFLNGRTPDLINQIKKEMKTASDQQNFEIAAVLRDKLFALEKTLEKQVTVTTDFMDRDVIAIAQTHLLTIVMLLFVRGGFLQGTRHFSFSETFATKEEIIETFLQQYYEKDRFIPKEILLPFSIDSTDIFKNWLSESKGKRVNIFTPQRGEKAHILKMAVQNAEKELKDQLDTESALLNMLSRLGKRLRMDTIPNRIECFDNSNISGTSPVAGMVVFENGKPDKSSYRKYKITSVSGPDDYASMFEILNRRFGKKNKSFPHPDLLMVDGGKGQLNIAVSILNELNFDSAFPVIGIAKKDSEKGETQDKIYMPGRINPVNFGREGDLILYLQRIRDEAHRFAISFHRKSRNKATLKSALDDIPGIGPKRKKALLKHFKTLKKIQAATTDELAGLPEMNNKAAAAVKAYFSNKQKAS